MRDAVSTGAFLSAALTVGSDLLVDAGVDLAPVPVLLDVLVSELLTGVTLDLETLDACPHLLGGGLVEPNVTLAAGRLRTAS